MEPRKSSHVVVLSSRGKGHINPVLTLSTKLASLGLSITVVLPDSASYSLVAAADLRDLDILLAKLPLEESDESGEEQSVGWTMDGVRTGIRSGYKLPDDYKPHQRALEKLLSELQVSPSPPCCVIVDMVLAWSEEPIRKLGLRRFMLYTAAATLLPLMLHVRELYNRGVLPASYNSFETMEVEGLPLLLRRDVPEAMTDDTHCLFSVHMGWLDHMLSSDGILFNTFHELESPVFDALRRSFPATARIADTLLPVGPLFPAEYFGRGALEATRKTAVLKSSEEERCHGWLDQQPERSVLFISFGSWSLLSPRQAYEVALGLDASRQRFLWVLPVESKSLDAVKSMLPEGFLELTGERGLVVPGWAPQHLILSHPATGGFLTHCGWNSTLEAVTLAGVPLIGWPFLADQPPNCRYLVDGLHIATEVHSDEKGFVGHEQVELAVREIMQGPKAEVMKLKAQELWAAAREAVSEGGSSYRNLHSFVAGIKKSSSSIA